MSVRDFLLWSKEAKRRALLRRAEMFGASLLPHQEAKHMRQTIDELNLQIYELDREEDIAEVEKAAHERLEEIRAKRKRGKT